MTEFDQNPNQATMLGEDLTQWHARMEGLMAQGARIIAVRGAGTVNGIERKAAQSMTATLEEYAHDLSAEGQPVVLMFDGHKDNPTRPDLGSVFGHTVHMLRDDPNVTAICAQTKSWYSPKDEGDCLRTAEGHPYETYVFDDSVPGGHAALTQSEQLVNYPGYEQVIIGAAGDIAYDQLNDLSRKATDRKVKVTVFKALLNPDPAIDEGLRAKLEQEQDPAKQAAIQRKLDQRRDLPFGALFTKDGGLIDEVRDLPGVRIEVVEGDRDRVRRQLDNISGRGTREQLMRLFEVEGMPVDQTDFHGRTPLLAFAGRGDMVMVEKLIAMGADINRILRNDRGPATALDAARASGNNKLVDKLVELGAKSGRELEPN